MIIVNMHEAKSTLSKLVKAVVEDGEVVRIARDGKPVVELKAVQEAKDPLRQNPRLAATLLADPTSPEDPEGWPA
jgi:prevent-host-death family protein